MLKHSINSKSHHDKILQISLDEIEFNALKCLPAAR